MKKIFTILLLFIGMINIKALENEYFKIEIPNGYKEEISEKGLYKWTKDDNYITITVSNNTQRYDILTLFTLTLILYSSNCLFIDDSIYSSYFFISSSVYLKISYL